MKLFHGSNVEVVTPKLMPMVCALDFGRAFYLTSDFEQASRWAKTSVLRRGEGVAVVNLYFKGAYSEEEALRRLLPQRLRDQFAMKTDVYHRLLQKNLVDYAIGMYEFYHVEAIENAVADLERRVSV